MMNAPIAPFIAHEKKDAFEMEQPNRGGLTRLKMRRSPQLLFFVR